MSTINYDLINQGRTILKRVDSSQSKELSIEDLNVIEGEPLLMMEAILMGFLTIDDYIQPEQPDGDRLSLIDNSLIVRYLGDITKPEVVGKIGDVLYIGMPLSRVMGIIPSKCMMDFIRVYPLSSDVLRTIARGSLRKGIIRMCILRMIASGMVDEVRPFLSKDSLLGNDINVYTSAIQSKNKAMMKLIIDEFGRSKNVMEIVHLSIALNCIDGLELCTGYDNPIDEDEVTILGLTPDNHDRTQLLQLLMSKNPHLDLMVNITVMTIINCWTREFKLILDNYDRVKELKSELNWIQLVTTMINETNDRRTNQFIELLKNLSYEDDQQFYQYTMALIVSIDTKILNTSKVAQYLISQMRIVDRVLVIHSLLKRGNDIPNGIYTESFTKETYARYSNDGLDEIMEKLSTTKLG